MKKRTIAAAVMTAILTVTLFVSTAGAYFTTYAEAKGTMTVHLKHEHSTPSEEFLNYTKKVIISADPESGPVYVRAKVFLPQQYTYECSDTDGRWSPAGDDYWVYNGIIASEEYNKSNGTDYEVHTSELDIFLNNFPADKAPDFHVVVVYEYMPVQYDENGEIIPPMQADWSDAVNAEGGAES